jgi:hypothetical protein
MFANLLNGGLASSVVGGICIQLSQQRGCCHTDCFPVGYCSTVPITLFRYTRRPFRFFSDQRNNQTSGPCLRVVWMMLPCCITASFLCQMEAVFPFWAPRANQKCSSQHPRSILFTDRDQLGACAELRAWHCPSGLASPQKLSLRCRANRLDRRLGPDSRGVHYLRVGFSGVKTPAGLSCQIQA